MGPYGVPGSLSMGPYGVPGSRDSWTRAREPRGGLGTQALEPRGARDYHVDYKNLMSLIILSLGVVRGTELEVSLDHTFRQAGNLGQNERSAPLAGNI